jgi:four helix bundle protein
LLEFGLFRSSAHGVLLELVHYVARSIICERAFEFAVRILKLCATFSQRGPVGKHVAAQLMRCGTSIGSNAEEAQDGQTKPDYIAKMSVSRKESRESQYWLRLAVRAELATTEEIAWELNEAGELRKMIVSAIKTAQSSSSRGSQT